MLLVFFLGSTVVNTPTIDPEIEALRELFSKAEQRLKVIETWPNNGLAIPVVNQLRYVGYHLLEHLTGRGTNDLDKAKRHCERAIYDAYELELSFYIETFYEFCRNYDSKIEISGTVPSYLDWVQAHQDAQELISTHHQNDGRGDHYKLLEPHIDRLAEVDRKLPLAQEQLNKRVQKLSASKRNKIILAVVSTIIALAYWCFPDEGKELGQHLKDLFPSSAFPINAEPIKPTTR